MLRIKLFKIVLDVNVFISSILSFTGSSHKIVELALDREIKVYTSLEILKELEEKLREEFEQPENIINRQLALTISYAEIIKPKTKIEIIKDDVDDNKFVECANEINADYIISWDKHLLKIKKFKEIKIINPTNFLKEFNESHFVN